jgi:predicted nucleic acid-binding protein
MLYADTSALARAYLTDEADHQRLRRLLREGTDSVVTSDLTIVELLSTVRRAFRDRRHRHVDRLIERVEEEFADPYVFTVLRFESTMVLPTARRLVLTHPLSALDAMHLAVALVTAVPLADGDPFTFVTRDAAQGKAARAEGLTVA